MPGSLRFLIVGAGLMTAVAARPAGAPGKTAELVAKGKTAFGEYCATCHGITGQGDGPAARTLTTRPRNFVTDPMPGGAPAVFRVLQTGVQGTGMTPFTYLPEEDRWAIAYYVESLGRPRK